MMHCLGGELQLIAGRVQMDSHNTRVECLPAYNFTHLRRLFEIEFGSMYAVVRSFVATGLKSARWIDRKDNDPLARFDEHR